MEYEYLLTYPYFDKNEIKLLEECLNSRWVTQGPMTERFENLFKEKHGGQYALAVSNCTTGLHIAMLALGIGVDDEVLVPAYTWITSANCIEYVGARTVFIDVDYRNFNIDPNKIEAAITQKTKAIVVVHEFGCAAPMNEIMKIAKKYSLYVVEDCACAIGTKYKGRPVGTFGDIGVFSFHPRKVITTGEGGMCITDSKDIFDVLNKLRNHGGFINQNSENYGAPFYMGEYDCLGYNYRLSDIQAAVGIAQMDKLNNLLMHRKECAMRYIELLEKNSNVIVPEHRKVYGSTYQSFVILLKEGMNTQRNQIMLELQKTGIQTKQGTHAVHRLEYYKNKYSIKESDYPIASYCEDCSITLPIYPNMTKENQEFVISCLNKSMNNYL